MRRSTTRRSLGVMGLLVTMLLLASCRTDWGTWGFGHERQGYNPWEQTVSPANVSQLQHKWAIDLGATINASPIVATGVNIGGQPTDIVYVGTEHGVFFAVSTSGTVLWSRALGNQFADCPDTPDKLFGVSASAVFDRAANSVYVMGGDGFIYALDPSSGATLPGWPVQITADPSHEFVYSAPTQYKNSLYIGVSSRCDAIPYRGRLVRIDTVTRASSAFWVTGSPTGPYGGAIWGWGGASVDTSDGDVYVATGNTIHSPETAFYGDHIVRLDAALNVLASHTPGIGIEDDDFGSTPTLFQKSGCPAQLVAQQKNGSLYLYDRDSIATGYRQKIAVATGSEFIGVPAYSPATQMVYVVNPTNNGFFVKGLLAFRLDAACNLQLAWQSPSPVALGSAPTIANGVAYYSDGFSKTVHAVDASTGASLWQSGAELGGPVLAEPIMVNGQLFVSGYDQKLHAYALP